MADPILYIDTNADQTRELYKDDPVMLAGLEKLWSVQEQINADIRSIWRTHSEDTGATRDWLTKWLSSQGFSAERLNEDGSLEDVNQYRWHARLLATQLLTRAAGDLAPLPNLRWMADERWTNRERKAYWRCCAIASRHWKPL